MSRFDHSRNPPKPILKDLDNPGGIFIYNRQRQPSKLKGQQLNQCGNHNGNCDQICTFVPFAEQKVRCLCQEGYTFTAGKGCLLNNPSKMLLFSTSRTNTRTGTIRGVSLDKPKQDVIFPIEDLSGTVAIGYHAADEYIYYCVHSKSWIGRRKVDGTNRTDHFIDTGEGNCEGIAIDWIGRNVYWTDESQGAIRVARIDKPTYHSTIVSNQSHPRSIVLDPVNGHMFWADWTENAFTQRTVAKIMKANMDGTGIIELISGGGEHKLQWPNGLTLYRDNLYWCDALFNHIVRLNITKSTNLQLITKIVKHPFGLAIDGNDIYWTEFSHIMREPMNKTNSSKTLPIFMDRSGLFDLRLYDKKQQTGSNGCSDVNRCSDICLAASATSVTCKCADGNKLIDSSDSTKCKVDPDYEHEKLCKVTQFQCRNKKKCIDKSERCNNKPDCPDKSDEENCTKTCKNPDAEYMCKTDGTCIHKRWLCDGENDCKSGEDELNSTCHGFRCPLNHTRCADSGRCIPNEWKCDTEPDCDDASDEPDTCVYPECMPYEFRCKNGRCIDISHHCDRDNDCRDNSDEENCTYSCKEGEFECKRFAKQPKKCISHSKRCDSVNDCPNGDDEENCELVTGNGCEKDEFECGDGFCIPITWKCDGTADCHGEEDENLTVCTSFKCPEHSFQCNTTEKRCIERDRICDGRNDCGDDSDEQNCTRLTTTSPDSCAYPKHLCSDDSTTCVNAESLCDGNFDCDNGEDELAIHCVRRSCSDWGICSQLCRRNYKGQPRCKCLPGYRLARDGFTCNSEGKEHVYILYSNRHEMRRLNVHDDTYVSLISGLLNTVALDYHYDNEMIFWTDVVEDKIYSGKMINNSLHKITPIIERGLAMAEGLAIDWIGNNIYWVESHIDQIEAAKLNGSFRSTIIGGNMTSPRAIALDPRVGYMFWSDWESSRPRIERATMSGHDRKIIVNINQHRSGGWPNGVTLDYDNERVYWIDARSDSIHTTDYDGDKHHLVLSQNKYLHHPFSLTTFGNWVYWTDWINNAVVKGNKWNGSDVTVVQKIVSQPFNVRVYHPKMQPKPDITHPCEINNGGCQFMCTIKSATESWCSCPHLTVLNSDMKTCSEKKEFILYSKTAEIRGVELDRPDYNTIPSWCQPVIDDPISIDYDPIDEKLYWLDQKHDTMKCYIKRADIVPKIKKDSAAIEEIVADTDLESSKVIAVDWVSRNLYFTSERNRSAGITLWVSRLDGSLRKPLLNNLKYVKSLALHPKEGLMYWSASEDNIVWNIYRAFMDGTKIERITNFNSSSSKQFITDITVDSDNENLFWILSDGISKSCVQRISTSSSSLSAVVTNVTALNGRNVRALAVYGNKIYYALERSIRAYDLSGSATDKLVQARADKIHELKIFHIKGKKDVKNGCSGGNGGCSQLCLPKGRTEVTCQCTIGFHPGQPASNCQSDDKVVVFATSTQIFGVSVENSSTKLIPPMFEGQDITALDVSSGVDSDYIYWVDQKTFSISRIRRDLSDKKIIIKEKVKQVGDIAVDWMAGNLYWTDSEYNTISVSKLNGSQHFVILHDLSQPKAIVLDPARGYMYWSHTGIRPAIMQARLDGSQMKILTKDEVSFPGALALDYATNILYWCDKQYKHIRFFPINGQNVSNLVDSVDCDSLVVYDGYVYWTEVNKTIGDSSRDSIIKRRKITIGNEVDRNTVKEPIIETFASNVKGRLVAIGVLDKTRQSGTNICSNGKSGCSDLCLYLGNDQFQCACAYGTLDQDEKTCKPSDGFLVFSSKRGLEMMKLDVIDKNQARKPIYDPQFMKRVICLALDWPARTIFYSDLQLGNIQSVLVDGGAERRTIVDHTHKVGAVEGLAYNPLYKELYWTSYTKSSIHRISTTNTDDEPELLIQLLPEDHPRAIQIDVCDSRMYWTNWNTKTPSIQRAYLGGWGIESIITTDIQIPNALAIDHQAQKLYWGDAGLDKIERCDFDGKNRVVVIQNHPEHIFSMAVYGSFIFWTDWSRKAVLRVNKYNGMDLVVVTENINGHPMGIAAFANDTNDCMLNPCRHNNGGCHHKCTVNMYGEFKCSCEDDYVLQADGRTCQQRGDCNVYEFTCGDKKCIPYNMTCDGINHCDDKSDENSTFCVTRTCPNHFYSCPYMNHSKCILYSSLCNGIADCPSGSDEFPCECAEDEYQCPLSMICIKKTALCDVHPDCSGAYDEMGCPKTDCSTQILDGNSHVSLIPCNTTTKCISPLWMCDGENDCFDWNDEKNCPTAAPTTQTPSGGLLFICNNGRAIPKKWKCDGENDCGDNSDESNCSIGEDCDERHLFQCKLSKVCIPNKWKCDGNVDCGGNDTSDEDGCPTVGPQCEPSDIKCKRDGIDRCIRKELQCDRHDDCDDGLDEANCTLEPVKCPFEEFRCHDGKKCIYAIFRCDGIADCEDKSDEPEGCHKRSITCPPGQLKCANYPTCYDKSKKCDGKYDCMDSSDETGCDVSLLPCGSKHQFSCRSAKKCINLTDTCNGRNDCGDWSDEISCGIDECRYQHRCQQICKNLNVGYRCECRHGYKLQNDTQSCEDINECDSLPCSQVCKNLYPMSNSTEGFSCHCQKGYRLAPDRKSCIAIDGPKAFLVLANRYYIRRMDLYGNKMSLISQTLSNAVAIEFDWKQQSLFWSDVTGSGSKISSMSMDGTNIKVLHESTVRNPDGIAVDWIGRNLYWCDKTTDTIEVSKLNGDYRKVLLHTGIQEPRAISVHPARGYIFYTDWGEQPHIGRLGMDGSDYRQIIREELEWPNALTIDYATERIYWLDARLDYIKHANLDGTDQRFVPVDSRRMLQLAHAFAVTLFEDYLYWTDWEHKAILRIHKLNGGNITNVFTSIHRPMDLQIIHKLRQPEMPDPCKNLNCMNLCLIKPGGSEAVCACPENHYLANDGRTCIANCTSSQFQCATSYKCIPFWLRCDGHDDCGDRSDEPNNGPNKCGEYLCETRGYYQCENATSKDHCIPPAQICDAIKQCPSGSDEFNCDTYTCLPNQFKCQKSKKCISKMQQCDGHVDCEDSEDEADDCVKPCAADKFQCKNGQCITLHWVCDKAQDCGDGSDEPEDCLNRTCAAGYIKCNNSGQCIPRMWECDGENDCGTDDKTDEHEGCQKATCDPTYFKCDNARCIPGRWKCDYHNDCGDNSDETDCQPRKCSESEFTCKSDGRCIPGDWKCNHDVDCADKSDEQDCLPDVNCTDGKHFQCEMGQTCIPLTWQCDGEPDCPHGSDEKGCSKSCTENQFDCLNSKQLECINKDWHCDGFKDCSTGLDESVDFCKNTICPSDRFKCPGSGACLPKSLRCDGFKSCEDGSDETNCDNICAQAGKFQCGKSRQCISFNSVCDHVSDCENGADESLNTCKYSCSHDDQHCLTDVNRCKALQKTAPCCEIGYQFSGEHRMCKDIDECKEWKQCQQRCSNQIEGRPRCDCDKGYHAVNNSDSCVADGDKYLLVTIENRIMYLKPDAQDLSLDADNELKTLDEKISLFDVDTRMNQLFVVLPEKRKIVTYYKSARPRRSTSFLYTFPERKEIDIPAQSSPSSVALDWVSKRIYWTDAKKNTIEMISYSGLNHTTVVQENLYSPDNIVIDVESRKMFWTERGDHSHIESANLDGSERQILVSNDIVQPTGVTIDYPNRRLYWVDSKLMTIETINLDGSNRRRVYAVSLKNKDEDRPDRIQVFESYLYITTSRRNKIYKIPKFFTNSSKLQKLAHNDKLVLGHITMYNPNKQKDLPDPCYLLNNCHSSALCVMLPPGDSLRQSCLCPNGFKMVNGTCIQTTPPQPDRCTADYCKHGGTCHISPKKQRKCVCAKGYTGKTCQTEACHGQEPCKNGGTCIPENPKLCKCPKQFKGDKCETDRCFENNRDYCNSKKSQGFCRVNNATGDLYCKCTAWFSGDRCQFKKSIATLCKDYCLNGGKCVLNDTTPVTPHCECEKGTTGERCEICDDFPCENDGVCTFLAPSPRPYCKCRRGYIPESRCQKTYCDDYCMNGGTCTFGEKKGRCSCPPRYQGSKKCEEDLCDKGYCVHGKCANTNDGSLSCNCFHGYEGKRCDKAQDCSHFSCLHGGTCYPSDNEFKCHCTPEYTGDHCHLSKVCLQMNLICKHNGTCDQDSNGKAFCSCPDGFAGVRCEEHAPSKSAAVSSNKIQIIVIPLVVLCIVVILIVVIAVWIYRRRKQSKPFRHRPMHEDDGSIRINNPIYRATTYEDENVDQPFDPDKQTNFSNPVYDSVFGESTGTALPDEERKELLINDQLGKTDLDDPNVTFA
ncbi:prolow-density lipoprotein receptor-related protein 1-like isoform X2 [Tubulanus polymorphus]|uniref:prolow-density lipoprotein receptor-related protein 1-like isoform X2 n=1 Tax=Tubulanus polymorphus TaxID=672921 RepID=UPI003DA620AF